MAQHWYRLLHPYFFINITIFRNYYRLKSKPLFLIRLFPTRVIKCGRINALVATFVQNHPPGAMLYPLARTASRSSIMNYAKTAAGVRDGVHRMRLLAWMSNVSVRKRDKAGPHSQCLRDPALLKSSYSSPSSTNLLTSIPFSFNVIYSIKRLDRCLHKVFFYKFVLRIK